MRHLLFPKSLVFLATLFLFLLPIHSALAHKLQMFATLETVPQSENYKVGFRLVGKVYYSFSKPFKAAEIQILSLDNKLIDQIKSDAEGRFRWGLKSLKPFKVQCRSIDGHLVERVVSPQADRHIHAEHSVVEIDPHASPNSEESLRHIISSELAPLKEQIHNLHHKVWLLEILGGLGLLFGGFGLWMFYLSKKALRENGQAR